MINLKVVGALMILCPAILLALLGIATLIYTSVKGKNLDLLVATGILITMIIGIFLIALG